MVAAKLRVVSWDKLQPGQRPETKLFDQIPIAIVALNVPMRRNRTQIHDADVTL